MKSIILALIGLLIWSTYGIAQEKTTTTSVVDESRIIAIEKDARELSGKIKELKEENAELKSTIKESESFYKNWQWVCGGLCGGGLLGFAFLIVVFIPKKVKNSIQEKITTLFQDRKNEFESIVNEFSEEQKIKNKYKLIVLTHIKTSSRYHLDLLMRHGFKVQSYPALENLQEAIFTKDDVLIINNEVINNEEAPWNSSTVEEFINAHPNLCFYIGRGVIQTSGDRANGFAASNIRTQFLGNLMNMLKYQ